MFRASLLWLICLEVFGFFGGIDGSKIPVCEDESPQEIYLDLSNVGLRRISKSFVNSSSVTCLNLANNEISSIAKESFDGLTELKYLNFAQNPAMSYKELMKSALPNLKSLVLDGSLIAKNDEQENRPLYNNYYSYSSTTTTTTRPNLLFSLPKLEKLSLNNNSRVDNLNNFLSDLDTPKLTHLYLSGNNLKQTTNIHQISSLTHLYLDDNEMENITGIFLQNLQHLSMDRNKINGLCGMYCHSHALTMHGMYSLQHLSLEGNMIEAIDSDAFDDLKNLRILNLAENQIKHFPKHVFDNMSNLKNLTLDKNNLTSVPEICALKKLKMLSLNGNKITSLHETPFCSLPKLAIIDLRNNGLTTISDETFTNLPAFSVLDLSWNNIQSLTKNWIPVNNSLIELHLDGNKFTDIASMSLEHGKKITLLSFGHNPIKVITSQSLQELPPNTSIDVSRDV